MGEKGSGDGQFNQPSGMLVKDGNLMIVDSRNNRIQTYFDGEFIFNVGEKGTQEGQFICRISEDSEGYIYIADWRNDRIQKFTTDGEFVLSIGESGNGPGQFNRQPHMSIDSKGNIYM